MVGGALFAQRGGKGAADAGNDDRIIARLVGGRVLRKGGRRKHRHGCRAQQRRREIHFAARNAHEAAPNHPTLPVCLYLERSEEHTSELQSLMRISYAVFCLKKKKKNSQTNTLLKHIHLNDTYRYYTIKHKS